MSDTSNTGSPEDEKETSDLLALLYPDEESGGEELGSEDSELLSGDELSSMQTLRSIFREMPEEEPSEAVTNKLLALAAQHAPTPQEESRGVWAWFQGLFQPVLGHPGFAAAATMVLVVGVAGTLYINGKSQLAEPEVASRAEPPAEPARDQFAPAATSPEPTTGAAPAAIGGLANQPGDSERLEAKGKAEAPALDSEEFVGNRSYGSARSKAAEAAKDSVASADRGFEFKQDSKERRSRASSRGGGDLGGAEGRVVKGVLDSALPEAEADDDAAYAEEESEVVREQVAKPSKKSAPARPKAKPSKKPSTSSPKAPNSEPPPPPAVDESDKDKPSEAPTLSESLHAKAVAAAKRGDCETVRSLGTRIRKADSGYYDRKFLSDARLGKCLRPAQAESK